MENEDIENDGFYRYNLQSSLLKKLTKKLERKIERKSKIIKILNDKN